MTLRETLVGLIQDAQARTAHDESCRVHWRKDHPARVCTCWRNREARFLALLAEGVEAAILAVREQVTLRESKRSAAIEAGGGEPLDLKAIEARIAEIEVDPRYQSGLRKAATVFENAPLALIQLGFEQEIAALRKYGLPLLAALREIRETAEKVSRTHADGIIAGYDAAVNDLRAVLAKVRDA